MLTGEYVLSGHDGPYAVERFSCTEDAHGWTWTATRHDPTSLALRGRLELRVGREQRLHAEAAGWVLRAGTVADEVLWRRGEVESSCLAAGLTGTSPAFLIATVRRLDLAVAQVRRVRLLAVTEPVLAPLQVDQQWERTADDDVEVTDLATGERQRVRLVDGLVEAPGLALTRA